MVLYMYNKLSLLENIPECLVVIVIGLCIGLYLRFMYWENAYAKVSHVEPHTYFLLLLPPIMFHVGFSMNSSTFFRNIWVINSFAIGGTLLSSLIFGIVLYYILGLKR